MNLKILFVCTGNTCRSPIAEGLARQMFGETIQVSSAGIEAWEGSEACVNTIEALRERNVDQSNHRSRRINVELLAEADWIIPMTQAQEETLVRYYPQFKSKIRYLGGWGEAKRDVIDPWRGSLIVYRQTAQEIYDLLIALKEHLILPRD